MGVSMASLLANYPNQMREAQDQHAAAEAQLPGIAAQSQQQQMTVQQMQRQLQDQKIFSDAFRASGGDFDQAIKAAAPNLSASGYLGLMNDHITMQKNAASLDKDKSEALAMHQQQHGSLLQGWHDIQDTQAKAAAWPSVAQRLNADSTRPSALLDPNNPPDENGYQLLQAGNNYMGNILAQAKTKAETAQAQAAAAKSTADTAEAGQRMQTAQRTQAVQDLDAVGDQGSYDQWLNNNPVMHSVAPPMYSPEAIAGLKRTAVPVKEQPEFDLKSAQARALQAYANEDPKALDAEVDGIVPPKDPMNASTKVLLHSAAARGDLSGIQKVLQDAYDQRGKVQVAKENAQNKLQIDLGGFGGSPGQPTTLAKMVGDYRMPLQTALQRTPAAARNALMDQVNAYNPQFQEQYYNTFQKTENDFTSGKDATSANALNTMMGHLSVLNQAADALKNNDVQAINKIANWAGAQVGQTPQTTYDTIVHRLGPEVTKAYLASGGSVGERGTNEEDFSSKLGPDQIKQNIGVSALLADSKIKALQDQYNRGTYGRGQQKLISDEAEQARQRLTTQAPAALRGGATPAAVKNLLSRPNVRPGIHTLSDGTTWMKNQDGTITPQ